MNVTGKPPICCILDSSSSLRGLIYSFLPAQLFHTCASFGWFLLIYPSSCRPPSSCLTLAWKFLLLAQLAQRKFTTPLCHALWNAFPQWDARKPITQECRKARNAPPLFSTAAAAARVLSTARGSVFLRSLTYPYLHFLGLPVISCQANRCHVDYHAIMQTPSAPVSGDLVS